MKNPIPEEVRGKIYLAGQISGPLFTVVTAILLVLLGASSPWLGVVAVTAGAFLTLTSTLARANLGSPENPTVINVTNAYPAEVDTTDGAE